MESSSIEPEFHAPYTAWKTTPGPESNAALLNVLKPTITGAIKTHVGENNPLIESRARKLVLDTMQGYAPERGRLSSYTANCKVLDASTGNRPVSSKHQNVLRKTVTICRKPGKNCKVNWAENPRIAN